jgi:hypothetical protein
MYRSKSSLKYPLSVSWIDTDLFQVSPFSIDFVRVWVPNAGVSLP